jgi:hypothetical protein
MGVSYCQIRVLRTCHHTPGTTRRKYSRYVFSSIYANYLLTSIQQYEVLTDGFHNVRRLNLYQWDGTPMNPMFLVYKPPQMLPTQTLNPVTTSSATATAKVKRYIADEDVTEPLNKHALVKRTEPGAIDKWWWFGVFMTSVGGVALFYA